jgi:hypothetical protein
MGADMVMAMMSYKRRETDDKTDGWGGAEFFKRVEAVRKACQESKEFDQRGVENYFEAVYGDAEQLLHMENVLEEVRAEFLKVIDDFEECFHFRDVGTIAYPERFLIFSGGLSYGDQPTTSYDRIDHFSQLPLSLLNAGGFE